MRWVAERYGIQQSMQEREMGDRSGGGLERRTGSGDSRIILGIVFLGFPGRAGEVGFGQAGTLVGRG